jgi:hypothetical protein
MASADALTPVEQEGPLTNPWPWLCAGVGLTGATWLWVNAAPTFLPALQMILVWAGVLAAGAAVAIRLTYRRPVFETLPNPLKILVSFALVLGGPVVLFAHTAGVGSDMSLVMLLLIFGATVGLIVVIYRHVTEKPMTEGQESWAVVTLAGLASAFAVFSLDYGDAAWDTLRLFLSIAALVALMGGSILLLPGVGRRIVISLLIVLHFLGILTAVTAAPPAPWLANVAWTYFYRPYLEFMYLNNAYHFYAPEPGPAFILWFRIEYSRQGDDDIHLHWERVPLLDEEGWPQYPLALQYQRRLALAENATRANAPPGDADKRIRAREAENRKRWERLFRALQIDPDEVIHGGDAGRLGVKREDWWATLTHFQHARPGELPPDEAQKLLMRFTRLKLLVRERLRAGGDPDSLPPPIIPFLPNQPPDQQLLAPNTMSKRLLESYTRHVAHDYKERNPDVREVKGVRVYRIVHQFLSAPELESGMDPNDWSTYLAHYWGEYDERGKLIDPDNPDLYWVIPILKVRSMVNPYTDLGWGTPNDPTVVLALQTDPRVEAKILNYVNLHAGFTGWILPFGEKAFLDYFKAEEIIAERELKRRRIEPGNPGDGGPEMGLPPGKGFPKEKAKR